jgi:hypothetical protein
MFRMANVVEMLFGMSSFSSHLNLVIESSGLDRSIYTPCIEAALLKDVELVGTAHNMHLLLDTSVNIIKNLMDTFQG